VGTGYSSSGSSSQSNSNATGGTGVGYGGTGIGLGGNSTAEGGKGGNATANGGDANATSTGSNASNGNVSNSVSTQTNIPRNAPPAIAPTMIGQVGTNTYSAGVSTVLGGVSVGKSTTTREGKELIKAQTAQIDIENLEKLDGMTSREATLIRRSIAKRYSK